MICNCTLASIDQNACKKCPVYYNEKEVFQPCIVIQTNKIVEKFDSKGNLIKRITYF
jgi:hypothetical protein